MFSAVNKMDGTKIHIAVNSLLECSICLQVFQDPRNLPCGHTFCLRCIQKIGNRLCSLCKREWTLPANGLQELPKNFIAENCITSLPSISHCAVAGNSSHGAVKFLCIDCWDPLCDKCGQGHTQFSRTTKNHVVKMINEIDQSDIELHNRQKALLCNQHKDKTIEFYCTNCDKFSCHTCYVLFHTKHECISVEDADAKLCSQIDNSVGKVEEIMNLHEKKVKEVTLFKEILENDKNKLLKAVKTLIDEVKTKLKTEFDKIIGKVDDYYKKLIKSIVEKTDERIIEFNNNIKETQGKLQNLKDSVSLFKRYTSPFSTPTERASFLKDNSITQLISKSDLGAYTPDNKLSDISQWKNDIDNWNQSVMTLLHSVKDLPQINDNTRPVFTTPSMRFVCSILPASSLYLTLILT